MMPESCGCRVTKVYLGEVPYRADIAYCARHSEARVQEYVQLTEQHHVTLREQDACNHNWSMACGIRPDVTPAEAAKIMAETNKQVEARLASAQEERDHLQKRFAQSEATWKGVCDDLEAKLALAQEMLQKANR